MRKTDYSNVADRYDNNKYRQNIVPDHDLKEHIESAETNKYIVLDLACGTGIYLINQTAYFQSEKINWYGLDASEQMLNKAKQKLKNVIFTSGYAENLPYDSDYFDFISNNYAFHHFDKKAESLDEIARVTKKNGIFKMHNISVHNMPKWWIYQFFPSAYDEDLNRFWEKEMIFHALSIRGFDVKMRLEYKMEETKITDFMDYAYNRDISILTLITDDDYKQGIELMEYKIKKDPEARIINDFADIYFIARKK